MFQDDSDRNDKRKRDELFDDSVAQQKKIKVENDSIEVVEDMILNGCVIHKDVVIEHLMKFFWSVDLLWLSQVCVNWNRLCRFVAKDRDIFLLGEKLDNHQCNALTMFKSIYLGACELDHFMLGSNIEAICLHSCTFIDDEDSTPFGVAVINQLCSTWLPQLKTLVLNNLNLKDSNVLRLKSNDSLKGVKYVDLEENFLSTYYEAEIMKCFSSWEFFSINRWKPFSRNVVTGKPLYNLSAVVKLYHDYNYYKLGETFYRGVEVPKDYKTAFKYFEKATLALDRHQSQACAFVGYMYEIGRGTEKNFRQALKYYETGSSSDKDNAFKTAKLYENGMGTPCDKQRAMIFFKKAADLGHGEACVVVAEAYETGQIVTQNMTEALNYYKLADNILKDDYKVKCKIGYMIENQLGSTEPYSNAERWYQSGHSNGHVECKYFLACLFLRMGKREEGLKLLEEAFELGSAIAAYKLGSLYEDGIIVPKDEPKAFMFYQSSADGDNKDAQFKVGYFYENGIAMQQSYSSALEWYEKAENNGSYEAAVNRAFMYLNGKGPTVDNEKGLDILTHASEHYVEALHLIGNIFFNGYGTIAQDYSKAFMWLSKGDEKGHYLCQYLLGKMYERGIHVKQDIYKALDFYTKSQSTCLFIEGMYKVGKIAHNLKYVDVAVGKLVDLKKMCEMMPQSPIALHILGKIYLKGLNVPQNRLKAMELFEKASALGNERSKRRIDKIYTNLLVIGRDCLD